MPSTCVQYPYIDEQPARRCNSLASTSASCSSTAAVSLRSCCNRPLSPSTSSRSVIADSISAHMTSHNMPKIEPLNSPTRPLLPRITNSSAPPLDLQPPLFLARLVKTCIAHPLSRSRSRPRTVNHELVICCNAPCRKRPRRREFAATKRGRAAAAAAPLAHLPLPKALPGLGAAAAGLSDRARERRRRATVLRAPATR